MTSRDDVTGGESLRTRTRRPLSISLGVSGLVSACLPVVVHLAVSVVNPVSTAITFGWLSVCLSVGPCVCVCVCSLHRRTVRRPRLLFYARVRSPRANCIAAAELGFSTPGAETAKCAPPHWGWAAAWAPK